MERLSPHRRNRKESDLVMKSKFIEGESTDHVFVSESVTVEAFDNGSLNLFIEQEAQFFEDTRWATVALSRDARMELVNALLDSLCTPDEK